MRRVVIGQDPSGRSTLQSVTEPDRVARSVFDADYQQDLGSFEKLGAVPLPTPEHSNVMAELWNMAVPPAQGKFAADPFGDLAMDFPEPGRAGWWYSAFGPHTVTPSHSTPTIDLNVILSGGMTLTLDSGEVEVGRGDVIIIPGLEHGWRTGEEPCEMIVMAFGLAGPDH